MTTRVLLRGQADYPPRLRDLRDPPSAVWVTGDLPRGPQVAIVGTRQPSPEGAVFAFDLAKDLAARGVAVLSGGAEGIDTAAHRGALAGGGPTVVVSPSGVLRPFPEKNAELFRNIVREGGAFLSAVPPTTAATQAQFFPRNAHLAALAHAVVVVETRYRGGARNAAKATRRLGRPLLVVPGAPWHPTSGGCLLELALGAGMVMGLDDVLRAIGLARGGAQGQLVDPSRSVGAARERPILDVSGPPAGEDPDRARVLDLLRLGPVHPDGICSATGLPAARVQALILTLTLEGIVVSGRSGWLSLASD